MGNAPLPPSPPAAALFRRPARSRGSFRLVKTFILSVFFVLFIGCFVCPAFALEKPPVPVIFIHGIASSGERAWANLREYLTAGGWVFGGYPTLAITEEVIFVNGPADFYTMNFSDYADPNFPSQHLSLEEQGRQLDAIIQAVRAANSGKDHVILVGHSMGGLGACPSNELV